MDKKAFKITSLTDNDASYWKKKTPHERLEALEQLRRIIFGYDPSATRLQKVLTITDLKEKE